jgi:hypothetical protein
MKQTKSYGADPLLVGLWALIVSPPAWIGAYLLIAKPTQDTLPMLGWSVTLVLLPVIFASRFRATFTPTEFVYRRWGPTIRVRYSAISRIETTDTTPSGEAIGAFIVTTDGRKLPFWPKLFPREAIKRFFALAQ